MSTALDILVTGRQNPYCNAWTQMHAHLDTFNQMIFLSSISCGSACRCKSCCKRFVGAERSGYGFRSIQHRGEVCYSVKKTHHPFVMHCGEALERGWVLAQNATEFVTLKLVLPLRPKCYRKTSLPEQINLLMTWDVRLIWSVDLGTSWVNAVWLNCSVWSCRWYYLLSNIKPAILSTGVVVTGERKPVCTSNQLTGSNWQGERDSSG